MPKFREEAQKAETGIRIIPRCEIIANAGQYARDKKNGLSLIHKALVAKAGGIIFSLWGDPKQVLPDDWLIEFKEFSDRAGIDFIGEPWQKDDLTQFERLKVKRYKVGYEDIVDLDLLDAIRTTGKPVLLSVGVATYSEIEKALKILRPQDDCATVTLLHRVYNIEGANLRAILDLKEEFGFKFNCQVGLESHLSEWQCDLVALAYGITVIEKDIDVLSSAGNFTDYVRHAEKSLDYRKFFTARDSELRHNRDE